MGRHPLAAFAALPETDAHARVIGIIWGVTVGLALAHRFAFGLGLAIVRQLLATDGGSIELRPAPGTGLDVVLRFRAVTAASVSQLEPAGPARARRSPHDNEP